MQLSVFHVRISVAGQKHDEVKNDLDEETLERQFLEPYRRGTPITVNGKAIPVSAVERIRVTSSGERSEQTISRIMAEDRQSSVFVAGGPSNAWRAASRGTDVTDQFITGPPGSENSETAQEHAMATAATDVPSRSGSDPRAVFVIAGRDSNAVGVVTALLRAIGLQVVEWEHAVARTGLPNPYVGDVVEAGLRMATAAVVLLTPDDLVQLRDDLIRDDDGPDERDLRGQARPNVYYEAGIADTLGRERTVIVEIGNVKSFSDAAGRHVVRYDGTPAKRHALVERLRLAGLDVNTTGQDWLSAGEVAPVLEASMRAATSSRSGPPTVDKQELIRQIDGLLDVHSGLLSKSRHDDLSDLGEESMQLVFQAQALVDRFAADTPYAAEAGHARARQVHLRLPVLVAVLRALRAEADG